jgi:hypothetical protein
MGVEIQPFHIEIKENELPMGVGSKFGKSIQAISIGSSDFLTSDPGCVCRE